MHPVDAVFCSSVIRHVYSKIRAVWLVKRRQVVFKSSHKYTHVYKIVTIVADKKCCAFNLFRALLWRFRHHYHIIVDAWFARVDDVLDGELACTTSGV